MITIIINVEKEVKDSRRCWEEPTALGTILERREGRGERRIERKEVVVK
jgi:hypothetical protein